MLRKELDYNWPEVDREVGRALQLCPESPLVRLRYAISGLLPHGRIEEGIAEIDGIIRNDPLSIFNRWWMAIFAYLARKPERAVAEGRFMISLDPSYFHGHWSLGIGLGQAGAFREAVPALQKAHELSGGAPFTLGFLAYFSGCAGRREEVRRLLEQAERAAAERYMPPTTLAFCHLGLDQWDETFEWLDRAIEARDPIIMAIRTFPLLDPLREDARFGLLLRKMRLDG